MASYLAVITRIIPVSTVSLISPGSKGIFYFRLIYSFMNTCVDYIYFSSLSTSHLDIWFDSINITTNDK